MSTASLPLRDVHLPPAPGAWPPAPGWSLLLAALCVLLALLLWHFWKRRRQQRRWRQLFDDALREAATPVAQLAAASGLLRRAARRARADVVQLQDEDWLHFLDGGKRDDFSQGAGRLLLDGGYRREIDAAAAAQACTLARARFLELMGRRR